MESRTQGSRPKTQKKSPRPRPRTGPSENRHSRGQGQECSKPRPRTKDTGASVLLKKWKVFKKLFSGVLQKKKFSKNFSGALQNFNNSKNRVSSSQEQGNFWELDALRPRPKPRTWLSWLRPKTPKCVLEDDLEAKNVLKYSTSVNKFKMLFQLWSKAITFILQTNKQ